MLWQPLPYLYCTFVLQINTSACGTAISVDAWKVHTAHHGHTRLVLMPGRHIQHIMAKPDYSPFVSLVMLSVLVYQFYTDVKSGLSFEGRTWTGGFWEQCEGEY